MGRKSLPAALKSNKDLSKQEKQRQIEGERNMAGNKDLIYSIPDSLDENGKRYYEFIVEELRASDILSNLDIMLVENTSDILSKIKECELAIKEYGMYYKDSKGKVCENPAVKTKLAYLREFKAFGSLLGLSPSARASLVANSIDNQDENDPLLQLLKEYS